MGREQNLEEKNPAKICFRIAIFASLVKEKKLHQNFENTCSKKNVLQDVPNCFLF